MMRGRIPVGVWGVLITAHLLALGWSLKQRAWNFPDTDRYLTAGENIHRHGQLYARPWTSVVPRGQTVQEFTIRPVGYPLVLMVLGKGNRLVMLLFLQNVCSLLVIGSLLKTWAKWAQPDQRIWWLVSGLLVFPAQVIYANAVMSEMLLQGVVMVMVVMALRFMQTAGIGYYVALCGAVVAAFLLKPVFYPLALVMAGVGMLAAWQRRMLVFAIIGLLPLAVAGLYMGWNWQRTGYFHFSSIAEINLLHYNAAGVVRQLQGQEAEEQWVAAVLRDASVAPGFAARQGLIQTRALEVLAAHPWVYAQQHLAGMATLFLDPGRFDLSQFLNLSPLAGGGFLNRVRTGDALRAVQDLPLGLLGLLSLVFVANMARLALAVRGFMRLKDSGPTLRHGRWVVAGLLLYVAVLTGPLGASRFLVPVWPLLLGLALVGLQKKPVQAGVNDERADANG